MDWSNENYVRIYTRDTGDLLAVGWEGRCVLWELIRKSDQAGVLDHGGDLDIVAEMIRMPHEIVATAIERLARRGVIVLQPTAVVIRNKLAAHAATKTDKQRQKESRERRLAHALAKGADQAGARAAARPDRYGPGSGSQDVTTVGHEIGPNGHSGSQRVTAGHSGSLLAELSKAALTHAPIESAPMVETKPKRAKAPPHPDHQRWVDRFTELYAIRHGGDKPTWGPKQIGIASRLLKAHGFELCSRRAEKLLTSPPRWLKGGLDIGTLEANFDKLAAPVRAPQIELPTHVEPSVLSAREAHKEPR